MRLKDYRISQGLTQAEMAARIGVRRDSYARYELGLRVPRREVQTRIYLETGGQVPPGSYYDLPALPAAEAAE